MSRILLVTSDAYGAMGGIAQYNRDLARAVASHPGVSELVIVPRNVTADEGALPAKVVQRSAASGGLSRFVATLSRTALELHADAVLCGHANLLPFASAVSAAKRAPLGLLLYGIEVWDPPRRGVVAELCKRVDHVASISDITLRRFRAWAGSRAEGVLLPNAIDLAAYAPGPRSEALMRRYGLEGAHPIFLTLARLAGHERYKGFDEMLAVLPRLRERWPGMRYLIAGDGDDRARLEAVVRTRGLGEQVVFTGRVLEVEKQDHYRLADVFAMPGRGEGFGFVFLEALACGIPVVASSLDGSKEAVRDGLLGELCDPRRLDTLVSALEAALAKPRGIVPEGLGYFDFPSFERRVHGWLDSWALRT